MAAVSLTVLLLSQWLADGAWRGFTYQPTPSILGQIPMVAMYPYSIGLIIFVLASVVYHPHHRPLGLGVSLIILGLLGFEVVKVSGFLFSTWPSFEIALLSGVLALLLSFFWYLRSLPRSDSTQ